MHLLAVAFILVRDALFPLFLGNIKRELCFFAVAFRSVKISGQQELFPLQVIDFDLIQEGLSLIVHLLFDEGFRGVQYLPVSIEAVECFLVCGVRNAEY